MSVFETKLIQLRESGRRALDALRQGNLAQPNASNVARETFHTIHDAIASFREDADADPALVEPILRECEEIADAIRELI